MHRTLLEVAVFGLLIAGCAEWNAASPTLTAVPSPVPVPTMSVPILIREIDIETETGTAYTLDWSPDGEVLAVASGYEVTLLSSDLKETHAVLRPEGGALGITWNPDQTKFATVNGFRNSTIKLWDWNSTENQLRLTEQIQADSDQYGVFWSPDGKLLATLADDDQSRLQIWDADTSKERHTYELPYAKPLRTFQWSIDNSTFHGAGESSGKMVVFALNVNDGSIREVASLSVAAVEVFAFSPDESKLAFADARGVVEMLNLKSGKVVTGFKSVDQPVDMAWNPNGKTLAILDYKTKLQLWNVSP